MDVLHPDTGEQLQEPLDFIPSSASRFSSGFRTALVFVVSGMAVARAEESVPVSALRPANTLSIVVRASISSGKNIEYESLSLGEIKTIARDIHWKLQKAIYGLPKGEERTIILQTLNEIAGAQYRPVIDRLALKPDERLPIDDEAARERLPAIMQLKSDEYDPSKLDQESMDICLALIREMNPTRVAAK